MNVFLSNHKVWSNSRVNVPIVILIHFLVVDVTTYLQVEKHRATEQYVHSNGLGA